MKASILFLSYNHEKFVAEALRSALHQDYPAYELIIHDDGSTDGTLRIIQEVLASETPSHIKITLVGSEKNCGLHESFNRGLKLCTGEIVLHISGDDISYPYRLRRHMEIYSKSSEVMLVTSEVNVINDQGVSMKNRIQPECDKIHAHNLKSQRGDVYAGAYVLGASASYRIEVFSKFEPIKKFQCYAEDNAYLFRALMIGKIYHIKDRLLDYRHHVGNFSDSSHNWREGLTQEAQAKHLRFLQLHGLNSIQWNLDINFALEHRYITTQESIYLKKKAMREAYRWHMYYMALSDQNWRLWFKDFLKASPWLGFTTSLSMFLLRFSDMRKNRYWRRVVKRNNLM